MANPTIPNPIIPTLKELMAAGAHFGHKKERSHPKSRVFTYVQREGIHIIDLEKTQAGLERAISVVSNLAKQGKIILFVGTKPQAADLVKAAAQRVEMPYIVNHWPGGLMTNFETVRGNLKRLEQIELRLESPDDTLTKKERLVFSEKVRKSFAILGGVRQLHRLPDALFVVDVVAELTAVTEAYRLGIPVIGICDTNANPEKIDYPIPANDDARKTIDLVAGLIADAIAANKAVSVPVVDTANETSHLNTELKGKEETKIKEETKTAAETVTPKPAKAKKSAKTKKPAEVSTEEKPKKTRKSKTVVSAKA